MYRTDRIGARRAVFILTVALVAVAGLAIGCATIAEPDIPEEERRASALNKSIMCPVCPGESIDQSQNPLALQMRAIVDEKLAEGWSEREIKDFFVERYGPSVLLEPPSEGFGIAAWIVPPLAFALALASLLLTIRWMRRTSERTDGNANEDSERVEYVRRLEAATQSDTKRNREEGSQ